MTIHVANPRRLALEAVAAAWAPPERIDYLAWAIDNVRFDERHQFKGPYNPDLFPFFSEILRALGPDDPCRTVSLLKSAQIGGTVLANVFLLATSALTPVDFLYTHPTEDNARRWAHTKLKPMLREVESLKVLFPEKSRDSADSVLFKERADGRGTIIISGASSASSLSMLSTRCQVQDDLSKWETNSAGDPESQADSRSQASDAAKIFKVSTPLVVPGCRISRNYEAGSQERYHVPCPHCGTMQALEWEQFRIDEERPERSAFLCVAADCGALIEDHHRRAIMRRGAWIAANPKAARLHRSFYLWVAYSPLQPLEYIARTWLEKRGHPDSEKVFFNDVVGRAYQVKGEAPPWEGLRDRAASGHARATIPAFGLMVTLGVDCQGDRVEWQAVAWSRDGRRAVVDHGIVDGHISDDRCRAGLDRLLTTRWRHASGRDIGIDMTAIDGNAYTEDVWGWARRHPASRVMMVRGVHSETAPLIERVKRERNERTGKVLKYSSRFFHFATSILKMALYRNLPKTDPQERGYVALPTGLDDEFFQELTAERRVAKRNKRGFVVHEWTKDPTQDNEMLDTHLQAEAAAIRYGVRSMPDAAWDKLEADRAVPVEPVQGDLEDLLLGRRAVAAAAAPSADAGVHPTRPAPTSLAERLARLNRSH